MHEKMESSKIVRVTEIEITEAAFAKGRKIVKTIDSLGADAASVDSFLKGSSERVRFLTPDASNAHILEQQLVEAYLAAETGSLQDNVQKLRTPQGDFDSLLYTKPVTTKLPDGSEVLEGVWNIWLPKKDLVLEIGKTK